MTLNPKLVPLAAVTAGLLLASTGGAVAGSMITGAQIKDNTVGSADIKNKTVKKVDLSTALVTSLKGARGPRGPQGTSGSTGSTGPTGAPGLSGYVLVEDEISTASGSIVVLCPDGKTAIGGGSAFQESNTGTQFMLMANGAGGTAYGTTGGAAQTLRVRVACATVG